MMEAETAMQDMESGSTGAVTSNPSSQGAAAAAWLEKLATEGTLPPCRTLVLSAEMAEEAAVLAKHGFSVKVVDPSREAGKRVKDAARSRGAKVEVIGMDLFRTRAILYGSMELIYDRAYFHTLEPIARADWAHTMGRFLPKGGQLLTWFSIGRAKSGPPYPITEEELRRLLGRHFFVETLEPAGAAGPDGTRSWRGVFRRK